VPDEEIEVSVRNWGPTCIEPFTLREGVHGIPIAQPESSSLILIPYINQKIQIRVMPPATATGTQIAATAKNVYVAAAYNPNIRASRVAFLAFSFFGKLPLSAALLTSTQPRDCRAITALYKITAGAAMSVKRYSPIKDVGKGKNTTVRSRKPLA